MKKILISVVCTLLAVLTVLSSVFTYWFSQNSIYIYDLEFNLEHTTQEYYRSEIKPFFKLSVYYSKKPTADLIKNTEVYTPEIYFSSCYAAHVTYTGNYKNRYDRSGYVFNINEIFVSDAKLYRDRITMHSTSLNSYYTDYEKLLFYYGIEYEVGKDYIILFSRLNHDSKPNEYNEEKFMWSDSGNSVVFIPLDEEYPYMEVYPGAIRYDATYFGANSKAVTKEEFVELVKGFAMRYNVLRYDDSDDIGLMY